MLTSVLSMTRCLKLCLALIAFFTFNVSQAQLSCPGSAVTGTNAGFKLLGTFNGHTYYISICGGDNNDGRFRGSQISSAVAGTTGYAATLHTAAENAWLANAIFAHNGNLKAAGEDWGSPRNAWIGFTDNMMETQFGWSSGEPVCYTNWNVDEPNDYAIGEDYTEMLIMDSYSYNGSTNDPFGKWNDWYNDNIPAGLPGAGPTRLPVILEIGPKVISCESTGDEGCTPGYWKNHTAAWGGAGLSPAQTLESLFDVPDPLGMDNVTLLEALQGSGGPGVTGAAKTLFRAAVAAMLNAAHPGVDYAISQAQILADVNNALASNNRNTMLALATKLDEYNNAGCSIDAHEGTDVSRRGGDLESGVAINKKFAISGYPNPSRNGFNIQINGLINEKVSLVVTDMTGRVVEQRSNVGANQVLTLGNAYRAGVYHIEVVQGASRQQLRMVKQ